MAKLSKRARLASSCLLACVALLCSLRAARAEEAPGLRRFALTVAANDGGAARDRLHHAVNDARAVAEVLEQLGGVEHSDAQELVQPTRTQLVAAFEQLRRRVLEAHDRGARTEVLFYYSGHSDDSAVLLAGERVRYGELRRLLDELPADVRIAILDSCASGAFTRLKGGVRRAPFLVDSSTQVQGHAFLTSSSADEAAQESDRIGGSFFTHYLVSGMRGAADSSGDRKITLTEAYRFAFEETLARTAQTQFGSQHPAYEIRLAGTGDLVMTDLRATSAELVADESVEGRLFVWDLRHKLLVEVDKTKGRRVVLALPPGRYRLELSSRGSYFAAEVSAVAGISQSVAAVAFREIAREATLARGVAETYELRPFGAGVIGPVSTNHRVRLYRKRPVMNHVDVALFYDDPDALEGLQLGLVGAGARRYANGLQLAVGFVDAAELGGVQLSGVANVVGSFASGLQLTFGANVAGKVARGLQVAFGVNYAGQELHGVQTALGVSYAGDVARGIQGAGVGNYARELVGVQLGGVNWARRATGVQFGGLNLARDVRGVQAGFMNVAAGSVAGVQVGLVNYADEADVSLGVLGITRKGGAHVQLTVSDVVAPEVSLRLDANYNYSFVSVGVAPYRGKEHRAYLIGAGLGAKAPLGLPYLWLDMDLGLHLVQPLRDWHRGMPNTLWQMRLLARVELHKHFSVFGGLTLNTLLQLEEDERVSPGLSLKHHEATRAGAATRVLYWPGFAFGVRL